MMAKPTIKVEARLIGQQALQRKWNLLNQRMRGALKRLVLQYTRELVNEAKRNTPVDMGQLRSRIQPSFFRNGLSARVEAKTGYAAFVEYGTGPLGRTTARNTPSGYVHSVAIKRPPPDVIFEWVWRNRKNMGGSSWTKSQAAGVAYLIGRSIGRRGLRARPFLGPAFRKAETGFERDMKTTIKSKLR